MDLWESQGLLRGYCAGCPSFTLRDERTFFGTGYKVLQSQGSEYFAACARARLNGKIQLVYFTDGYQKLVDYCAAATPDACQRALMSVARAVEDVAGNGFLSVQNVVLDPELAFVDVDRAAAKLLYAPVTFPVSGRSQAQVIQALFELCWTALDRRGCAPCSSPNGMVGYGVGDMKALKALLQKPVGAMHSAGSTDRGGFGARSEAPAGEPAGASSQCPPAAASRGEDGPNAKPVAYNLVLKGPNYAPATFRISDPSTVVGKSLTKAQVSIRVSQAVSRTHCRFAIGSDGLLSVIDLGSKNGTFVDGKRVSANAAMPVPDGATVRLADVPLLVERAR